MVSTNGAFRARAFAAMAFVIVAEAVVAGRIAVAEGFVAGFPPQTTQQLNDQWLFAGSGVSIPLPPLVALAVFAALAQLRPRWARIVGSVGGILLAGLFVVASFGEPTFVHPVSALEFGLQLLVFVFAIALGLIAAWNVVGAIRRGTAPTDQQAG